MLSRHQLAAILFAATATMASPASTAPADGVWTCRAGGGGAGHSGGALVGQLTVKGSSYDFLSAKKGDPSTGRGTMTVQGNALTSLKGPIATELGMTRGAYARGTEESISFWTPYSDTYSAMGCLRK